jgi:superfamily II DNA or RNA helicase
MSSANKNAKSILVFVPSHYLANQWKKAASSNLEVIALKSTGKFVYNKPEKPTMFITTYDLIESAFKIKDKRFYELRRLVTDVDMSIMDECHNLGANTLMKLFFLPIKFKLYLTATFRRHDGREVLMSNFIETKKDMPSKLWKPKTIFVQHFINKVFSKTALINKLSSKGDSEEKINAKIDKLLNYYLEEGCIIYNEPVVFNNRYDNTPLNIEGTYALTKYFKTLVKSEDWPIINSLIGSTYVSQCSQVNYDYEYLDSVVKFLEQVTLNNRKVLVVSNRLNALYYLHSKIDSSLVTGSDKITDEFTEYVASKNVILGSIQLADEGIDIPQIDTLLILTPKKDLAQFYGRGRRTFPNKKYPLCFVPKYNLHTLNMWNIENIFFNEVSLKISEITESFEEATKYLKRVK